MIKKAQDFFTDEEKEHIRLAVASAEAGTSGQIATMVVAESDSYLEARFLGVMFLSGLLALVVSIIIRHVTIWSYIPLAFLLGIPTMFLFVHFPRLKLAFVGRKRLNEAVRNRAVKAFYEKGLYRTMDETGVLIFISLLERKVWILGDRGINVRIRPESWGSLAAELAIGIREGHACSALCSVISSCGGELARHFPKRADRGNELPDEVIT